MAERGRFRLAFLLLGPVLGALAVAAPIPGLTVPQRLILGITVWTAFWWVTEPVPIPIASLLPAILLPACGLSTAKQAAQYYTNHLTLLLLGGFFIAQAIERWGLHRRIAIFVIGLVGQNPRQLVFGFVLASAFLSMWISNTATTIMLVPIALSVVSRLTQSDDPTKKPACGPNFAICTLLGVAYGANVGGVGSLIGTPPNLIFAEVVESLPGYDLNVDFLTWMMFGLPVVVIFAPLIAFLLTRVLLPVPAGSDESGGAEALAEERTKLGPMSIPEKRVLMVFVTTAILWITKGGKGIPGWSHLFVWADIVPEDQLNKVITDSFVALSMALVLFGLPSGQERYRPLLVWKDVETVPWGLLFLLGGGFAIAGAFESTGLSQWFGQQLAGALELPRVLLVTLICLGVTFLTEVTSNTATTNLLMPILAGAATEGGLHPLTLMLPAVLVVSFAFMLPVATVPNAIVFSTGRIPIMRMVQAGFVLNLVGTLLVLAITMIALPMFGVG